MDQPLATHDHLSQAHTATYNSAHEHAPTLNPPVASHPRKSSFNSTAPPPPSSSSSPPKPRGPLCTYLGFLLFMRMTSAISLLTIAGVTCEAIHQTISHKPDASPPDFFTAVLALVFHFFTALLLVLAMFEVRVVLRRIPLFASFLFLGLAQCYLAVLVLSNATVPDRFDIWLVDVMRAVCGALFFVGCAFAVLGCVGGKGMERRRLALERDRQRRRDAGEILPEDDVA